MTVDLKALLAGGWLHPADAAFADALGRLGPEADPHALLAAAATRAFSGAGHVCLDLEALGGRPVAGWEGEETALGRWPEADEWRARILASALVSRAEEPAPLVVRGHRVYLRKLARAEERVAAGVRARARRIVEGEDGFLLERRLDAEFGRSGAGGTDEQRRAAACAAACGFSVITGGPGTGKTTALARCLAIVAELEAKVLGRAPRIALAAPTGRAAARMSAAVAAARRSQSPGAIRSESGLAAAVPESAVTVHRLLGYNPRAAARFAFGRARPLPYDVIAVDEASMVSLSMMDALLAAAPERARIVLLGDRHQLASVQAGAVLADLCAGGAGVPWIAELSRSHRFEEASGLGDLARAVNSGRTADAMAALDAGRDRGEVVLHPEPDARAAVDEIARRACALFAEMRREADPAGRLGLLARSGVLCAHRRGALGAEHVNREVERRLVASGQIPPGAPWYDGRPVIALRNDPRAGISNGDMGVVCRAAESAQLAICFAGEDGRVRALAPGLVGAHETAFAITVHKAQGSEFDEVAVVLPAAPSPVTTRELLYTAVTRARSRVEIFGRPEVIAAAIETPTVRFSGLAERLSGG